VQTWTARVLISGHCGPEVLRWCSSVSEADVRVRPLSCGLVRCVRSVVIPAWFGRLRLTEPSTRRTGEDDGVVNGLYFNGRRTYGELRFDHRVSELATGYDHAVALFGVTGSLAVR
jgi:hypothetical protein